VGSLVQRDAQADLDLPAGHADLLDDQAEQPLAAVEVERVDAGAGLGGEVADALAQAVVLGQRGSLTGQRRLLGAEPALAGLHLGHPTLELGQLQEPGLLDLPAAVGA